MNLNNVYHPESLKDFQEWFKRIVYDCRRIPRNATPSFTVEGYTSEMAAWLLTKNPGNRNQKPQWVASLKRTMIAGDFKTTHQGLAISKTGLMLDGQHRSQGVVDSLVPIDIKITFNIDDAAVDACDVGKGWTGSDVFARLNIANGAGLTAGVRLIMSLEAGLTQGYGYPLMEVTAWVEENSSVRDFLTISQSLGRKKSNHGIGAPARGLLAAFYLIHNATPEAPGLDVFIARLADGANLATDHPIYTLRAAFDTEYFKGGEGRRGDSQEGHRIAAAVIKTWNLCRLGKKAKAARSLLWNSAEPFPVPVATEDLPPRRQSSLI